MKQKGVLEQQLELGNLFSKNWYDRCFHSSCGGKSNFNRNSKR